MTVARVEVHLEGAEPVIHLPLKVVAVASDAIAGTDSWPGSARR